MLHLRFPILTALFYAGRLADLLAGQRLRKTPDDGGTRMTIDSLLSRLVTLSLLIKPLRMHAW
jgi:hypothetical protein